MDELIKILNPESNYVFYDDAHGFCINTQDVLDHLCAMPSAQPGCEDAVPWEQLERYAEWFCALVSYPEFVREAKAFCESTIAAMKGGNIAPSVTPKQPGWIPCKTALPTTQTTVIVSIHDDSGDTTFDYSDCGWYMRNDNGNGGWWVVDNELNSRVVAWMPLPKPYREGKQNEAE